MLLPKSWYEVGIAFSDNNAEKLGIPIMEFSDTFKRFNKFATEGNNIDSNRGNSKYDNYYGGPKQIINPNFRPLHGKLYTDKMVLSDLGTCERMRTAVYSEKTVL